MGGLRLGSIVLGVSDVARARGFWCAALDYTPRDAGDETWLVLLPRSGVGPNISLGLSETPVQSRPRVHLDLYTADPSGELARLLDLGASTVDWNYPDGADFTVLADPEGNRFCVIDKSAG